MKRRKQIGKLIYTPRWGQGDVALGKDYDELTREEKLDVLAQWITELLSFRNAMIPNPKSWHHFMGEKEWVGLTENEIVGGDGARCGTCVAVKYKEREWVGLTREERDEIQERVHGAVPHHVAFAHAIEQALKEKNGG